MFEKRLVIIVTSGKTTNRSSGGNVKFGPGAEEHLINYRHSHRAFSMINSNNSREYMARKKKIPKN